VVSRYRQTPYSLVPNLLMDSDDIVEYSTYSWLFLIHMTSCALYVMTQLVHWPSTAGLLGYILYSKYRGLSK